MCWALLAVCAVYSLAGLFPDPSLAFYVGRGWLGCLGAYAGIKVTGWVIRRNFIGYRSEF